MENNQGWIKLHRKLIDSAVFDNPKLLKVWIWCLCKASYQPYDLMVGNQIVHLQEGQFVYGRLKASSELQISESMVYKYMNLLKSLHMVSIKANNKYSVVTIEKWTSYQGCEDEEEQQIIQQRNNKGTAEEQQRNINKKNKNNKNIKNIKNNIFIIPSVDEVSAYCQERNNGIDAEAFVSFYESKGWMIGKNKMKDWKAAVRTWEKKNVKKGNENARPKYYGIENYV